MSQYDATGATGVFMTVEASNARKGFRDLLDQAYLGARRILITRHGKPAAVLVSMREFAHLRKLDREADLRLVAERDTEGEPESFESFAAEVRGGGPGAPGGDALAIGQLAAEIAEELVGASNSRLRRQTRDLAEEVMERRFGSFQSFTAGEAREAREYVLEHIARNAVTYWISEQVPA